jgi:hypothetical protein
MIRFISLAGLSIAAASLFTPIASAQTQQVCFTSSLPLQNTNWNGVINVPKFDAGLGTLTQIDFTLTGNIQGSASVVPVG